jgi:tetratricopeptide (TPR) repeat protein
MLTYMADFTFFGLSPAGYHLTNLIFHVLNGLIVFAFIAALSRNNHVGFLTAMFFAVHPLRVESVAWVAELKDVLSSFFMLLSLWAYVKFLEDRRQRWYFSSLVLVVLSLLSKPMAVSLPFVFLLIDYHSEKKLNVRSIVEKWPFFALAVIFSMIAYFAQSHSGALSEQTVLPLMQRIALPFFGVLFYLYKTVVPVHLCAFYPYEYGGLFEYPYGYIVAATGIGAAAFFLARHSKKALFGLLFYLVTLLPVLQIVPIGTGIAAERYSYVPMIGIYYLIALGGERLLRGAISTNRAVRIGFSAGLGAVFLLLAFLTFKRSEVWRDSVSLWSDAVAVCPSPLAFDNLGNELQRLGRNDEALVQYRRALAIFPNDPFARCNIGNYLLDCGKTNEAVAEYRRAIANNPNLPDAHINLGNALMISGKTDEALTEYLAALKLNPNSAEGWYNFGTALLQLDRTGEAIVNLRKALELAPDHSGAHNNLGAALLKTGSTNESIIEFRKALESSPNYEEALENLGLAYLKSDRAEDAIACFRRASVINSSKITVLNDLGNAFLRNGEVDSALCVERTALALAQATGQDTLATEIGRIIEKIRN